MNVDYDAEVRQIARALSEIAHTLEGVDFAAERVGRVLVLAREVVPYAQCALLEVSAAGELELITVPELAEPARELLRARLASVLHALADADGPLEPGDSAPHLMLPVMGLDRVIGVVRVTPMPAVPHQAKHVRLLSVIAAQIGAYLAMIRLHDEQRRVALDLSAASEFQQRLVGIVSHDLRNPLAVITTVAASLLPKAEDQRQARALQRALRSAQRATRIIGDLVDVTQARVRGELSVVRRSADLRGLIAEVVEDEQTTNPDRVIELDDQVGAAVMGRWDPDRISQLAVNLISNALQYGDPERPIRVAVAVQDGHGILAVHNHGAGIPADLLPHLFDPFRRGTRQRGRGLGLGLFIVDQIARAHGGAASVESASDRGTTFTVRLPISDLTEALVTPPTAVTASPSARPMVMVVDDDLDIRVGMAEILESSGYRVIMASNGAEALALLQDGLRPRLVLLDLDMPIMTGEELCAACQADPALAAIPVLIISADTAAAVKAARFGAAVLAKPVRMDLLVETVAGLSA
jgi:signal transduction histidine kinase